MPVCALSCYHMYTQLGLLESVVGVKSCLCLQVMHHAAHLENQTPSTMCVALHELQGDVDLLQADQAANVSDAENRLTKWVRFACQACMMSNYHMGHQYQSAEVD